MWLFKILMCFFFFSSNNVKSYDPQSDSMIHNPTYLSWFYVRSRFWQPCQRVNTILKPIEEKKLVLCTTLREKRKYDFSFV